jgi:hypothetical protein
MDTKLLLTFILLFLSFLLLFYYLKLKTNIVILLSIIVVLCINKLIVQKEYFTETNYIHRDLIDYMIGDTEPPVNKKISLPFNGSNINIESIPTTSFTWKSILKQIKGKYTNDSNIATDISPNQLEFDTSVNSTIS